MTAWLLVLLTIFCDTPIFLLFLHVAIAFSSLRGALRDPSFSSQHAAGRCGLPSLSIFHLSEKFSMASVGLETAEDTGGSCPRSFCISTAFVFGAFSDSCLFRLDARGPVFFFCHSKGLSRLVDCRVSSLSLTVSSFASASCLQKILAAIVSYCQWRHWHGEAVAKTED